MVRQPTLYDRIGGEEGVAAMIESFYERVLADPELAPFFEKTPMERLRRMQCAFFSAALDGPVLYDGHSLVGAHYGRGIRPSHLGRFVQHLVETLHSLQLAEADVLEIIDRVNTYTDKITGDTSVGA